ncbi:chloride channel protein [Hippea sp. KM1]|uniref:chloride channel protein n=1 Tax=Hippea sp. KM1 TaxID=944481 RepID=UPI00046D1E15|nr:chloride channel protein [Hippea sp. KM1]
MKVSPISELMFIIKSLKHSQTSKMLIYASIVGVLAGVGAIVFFVLLDLTSVTLLNHIAGFPISHPTNEEPLIPLIHKPFNRIAFLIIITIGGFISGLLIHLLAEETKGGGTGEVVKAYHNNQPIRKRVPFVKLIVSVISLGVGGAGGREGPAAQIGAGFGYQFGNFLKLTDKEKRILMIAGLAGGVGAIFRSPMGAAIYAVEVLYKDIDFEYEALLPAAISSIIAYSIFSAKFGWVHMFSTPPLAFHNLREFASYTVLAVVCALSAIAFINIFNASSNMFSRIKSPLYIKTALGGFLVGLFAMFIPDSAGMGYGIMQSAFLNETGFQMLLMLGLVRMFTTSITLGSGNSVGLFAPTLVIGTAIGGGIGGLIKSIFPMMVDNPASFAIVGMAGFFAATNKTPLSIIIVVAEITGNYELIVPSMWVVAISFLLTTRYSIEKHQVKNRAHSPIHKYEFVRDVLEGIKVKELMKKDFVSVSNSTSLAKIFEILSEAKQTDIPIIDNSNKLQGIVTLHVLKSILGEGELADFLVAEDVANKDVITTTKEENLNTLMHKIGFREINTIPVVDDEGKVIGIITRKDIIKAYNDATEKLHNR